MLPEVFGIIKFSVSHPAANFSNQEGACCLQVALDKPWQQATVQHEAFCLTCNCLMPVQCISLASISLYLAYASNTKHFTLTGL